MGVDYDLEAMTCLLAALVETHGGNFDALPPNGEVRPLGDGLAFR